LEIEQIILENFRSYQEHTLIDGLSNINSFVGPNAVGKSNLFEALKLIQTLLKSGQLDRTFTDITFDRNPETIINFNILLSLSETERNKLLKSLIKGNSRLKLEEIKKTQFLKNIVYSLSLVKI
jgi:AAA15 family ATPase/GTPase